MAEYIRIPVEIQIEVGGEIHRRLLRCAEHAGETIEEELEWLVRLGINNHLRGSLRVMESVYGLTE